MAKTQFLYDILVFRFTGYFEKEIEASLKHDSVYKHPIYAMPKNPNYLNFTRKQIENGALKGNGLEIAYAKSFIQ